MKHILATCLLLAAAQVGTASVIFQAGNNGSLNDENIQFNDDLIKKGLLVQGQSNQTKFNVDFFEANETLDVSKASGQAVIKPTDGSLTDLSIKLTNPKATFGSVVFNLIKNNAPRNPKFNVTLTAFLADGNSFSAVRQVGNGSNFFSIYGNAEEAFTKVSIDSSVVLTEVKQVRIGGYDEASAVPEPSSVMLLGSGLGGLLVAARRFRLKQ